MRPVVPSNLERWALLTTLALGLPACGAPDESLGQTRQGVDSFIFKKRSPPLVASDAQPYDNFGTAVGVSSLWAAVGSPGHDLAKFDDDTGAATVFERKQGNVWEETAQLAPEQSWNEARFGTTIAVTDQLLVLGAPDADPSSDGSKFGAGSVAPFSYRAGSWVREPLLSDPLASEYRAFGSALALDDQTLLVGANGGDQVFVFDRTDDGWSPPITIDSPTTPGSGFGFSVALQEPYAFIGAPFDDDGGPEDDDRGAVFVYEHAAGTWNLKGTLVRNSFAPGDLFGAALAVKGKLVVAAAYGDVSVVAFEFTDSSSWDTPRRLVPTVGTSTSDFGRSLAIGVKNSIWVGASLEDEYRGVVYPFLRAGLGWEQDPALSFADAGLFGFSIASASAALMVGAPRAGENEEGSVYVIETSDGSSCSSDDDCFSTHCVNGMCCNSVCDQTCFSCLAAEKESATADGTCGPRRLGAKAPDNGCEDRGPHSCDTNGLCDGQGACQRYIEGTQCSAPFCSDHDLIGPGLCDGKGSCVPPEATDCKNYACDEAACTDGCSSDSACDERSFCNDSRCRPKLGFGASCSSDSACLQGHCVDGICCDTACEGSCEACSEEGSVGTCSPITAGSTPRGEPANVSGDVPQDCSVLFCDGETRGTPVMPAAAGTLCSVAGCADGTEVGEGRCDGAGQCVAPAMNVCGAYACSRSEARKGRPEQCLTTCDSVADCAPQFYCTTERTCRPNDEGAHESQGCSVSSVGGVPDSTCLSLLASALGLFSLRRRRSLGHLTHDHQSHR